MDITAKEAVFLALAVIGLFATWVFNVQWFMVAEDTSFFAFFMEGYTSYATTSLTNDLIVVALAFCVWVPFEAKRCGMKHGWAYIPLALLVALAMSYPLFLFNRSRALRAREES